MRSIDNAKSAVAAALLLVLLMAFAANGQEANRDEPFYLTRHPDQTHWVKDLFVANPDRQESRVLHESLIEERGAAWSPDGQRVAFHADVGLADVFVMRSDGSHLRNLTETPDRGEWQPSWSPDGRWLAFSILKQRDFTVQDLAIVAKPLAGGDEVRLVEGFDMCAFPAWSPDGRLIAFSGTQDGATEIHVVDRHTREVMQITRVAPNGFLATQPTWSPDGTRIAFAARHKSGQDIYVVNADGSDLKRLTNEPRHVADPAWSPDGRRIAYVANLEVKQVYVMNQDGSNPRPATGNTTQHELDPTWGPRPKEVTYTSFSYVPEGRGAVAIYETGMIRSTPLNVERPKYSYATRNADGEWIYTPITKQEAEDLMRAFQRKREAGGGG